MNSIFQLVKSLFKRDGYFRMFRVSDQNASSLQTNRSETASTFVFFKMTWCCVAES